VKDPALIPIIKNIADHISAPKSRNESLDPGNTKEVQKSSPRNKNRLVAERSADMYLGGLMCE
jgi:hypothetical protein